MVDERAGGGHGEDSESVAEGIRSGLAALAQKVVPVDEIITEEQQEQVDKAVTVAHHRARFNVKEERNPQTVRNLRALIQRAHIDPEAVIQLRRHAAILAVDMERGMYRKESKDSREWKGSYSIAEIMRAMGYYVRENGKRGNNPVIFREPEWSRAVEWERLKRDASYRQEIDGLMPMMKVGLNAMLMQIIERALVRPESIPDHVLFPETRKMMDMVAEFGKQKQESELDNMAEQFMKTVKGLPEGAREIAIQAFQTEVRMLIRDTSDVKKILNGDDQRQPEAHQRTEKSIMARAAE